MKTKNKTIIVLALFFSLSHPAEAGKAKDQKDVDAAIKSEVVTADQAAFKAILKNISDPKVLQAIRQKLAFSDPKAPKDILKLAEAAGALSAELTIKTFVNELKNMNFSQKIISDLTASVKRQIAHIKGFDQQIEEVHKANKRIQEDGLRIGRDVGENIVQFAYGAGMSTGKIILDENAKGTLPIKNAEALKKRVKEVAESESKKVTDKAIAASKK